MEVFSDGASDWGGFDPDDLVDEFDWLVVHAGPRGSERRVVFVVRTPDGVTRLYPLDAAEAKAAGAELIERADADAPPKPPWSHASASWSDEVSSAGAAA